MILSYRVIKYLLSKIEVNLKPIKNVLYTVLLISALLLSFSIGFMLAPDFSQHKNPQVQWNVYAFKDGVMVGEASGNLITDIGEIWIRDWAAASAGNTTSRDGARYISLTNTASPAADWTKLTSEVTTNGFDRNEGTVTWWVNSGDAAFNVTKTFTATGTQQLQTAGLNWVSTDDSDGNLFAAASFTQTTFNAGDTLTITWIITIDAN